VEGDPGDLAFFAQMESHRVRGWIRLMRRLPSDPRCAICRTPFGGFGGRLVRPLGFAPSRKNPRLCSQCFEKVPVGSVEMDVGVLFADVRGYTALTEQRPADEVAALLNRFYAAAVDIVCRHAILDKFVGDQVMALYIPRLFGDDVDAREQMLADAREILAAAGDWLDLGIGLDFGPGQVGNVGSGEVKDFTALGDVVNTAARLQGVAESGQIVASRRVAPGDLPDAVAQSFALKGKAEPVEALVLTPTRSSRAAST
jgi:adenylate cyclase